MNIKTVLLSLGVLISIPALWLHWSFGDSHAEDLRELQMTVDDLDRIGSEINSLALRARFNIDKNYDKLSSATLAAGQLLSQLQVWHKRLYEQGETTLVAQLGSYLEAWEIRLDTLENFKSHNSVLRNSSRYAPEAAEELRWSARRADVVLPGISLDSIRANLLEYAITNSRVLKINLNLSLQDLAHMEDQLPGAIQSQLQRFHNHVSVVLDKQETTQRYLNKVISGGSAQPGSIKGSIADRISALEDRQQQRDNIIAAYILLMTLGLLIVLGYQALTGNRVRYATR
ncbi:DAHL domain-containing protein [Parendozoicomonas sp. Alg238-R29]|uniref:DAHL domain-containing protein n=1 Tax=Parendozoicomonas sp. Alg238-R29 TaxID=2993446 RepID=UPI00248F2A9D|nr:DAHL domain-containing protein [Parendozoicomonas sp. Alg238-R29]